jgi:hypothetical protein
MKSREKILFSLDERAMVITSGRDAACCIGGKRGANTVFHWVISQDSVSFCSSMGCPGAKLPEIAQKMPFPSEFGLSRSQHSAIFGAGTVQIRFFFRF